MSRYFPGIEGPSTTVKILRQQKTLPYLSASWIILQRKGFFSLEHQLDLNYGYIGSSTQPLTESPIHTKKHTLVTFYMYKRGLYSWLWVVDLPYLSHRFLSCRIVEIEWLTDNGWWLRRVLLIRMYHRRLRNDKIWLFHSFGMQNESTEVRSIKEKQEKERWMICTDMSRERKDTRV